MHLAGRALIASMVSVSSFCAMADSFKVSRGLYRDSQGLTRERLAADAQLELTPVGGPVSAHSYKLGFFRDAFAEDDISENDYAREVYGSERRVQGTVAATAVQTWRKLTETRLLASYASDRKVTTRTIGVGASHWLPGESWRVGLDLSESFVDQPLYQTLDYDSQLVGRPPHDRATGTSLTVRQLATPSTLLDYLLSYVYNRSRPPTKSAAVQLRQFVSPIKGAVHAGVTRAYNRGSIDTRTDYGQVDAWTHEIAWLQHLWTGAQARLGYRYYREDETTRAYEDERVFGSDTVALGLAQDVERSLAGKPMVVDIVAARYVTNTALAATTFEVGLTAKF